VISDPENWLHVGSLATLAAEGKRLVSGSGTAILVLCHQGRVYALDNRCPHLGFPLDRGSVDEGILTCHWHHARFELASGCTFDLWADDAPTFEVQVEDGEVWVARRPKAGNTLEHWRSRLQEGMAHDIGLVIGKAVHGWLASGADYRELLREAAVYAAANRDGWGTGATILTALGALVPTLDEERRYLALYHGIARVAADCADQVPRRARQPLRGAQASLGTLQRWLRQWLVVRHRDAAERTLLTAIATGATPGALAELLLVAATDRCYADTGHALDFVNKAFECLDQVGWEHASRILPGVLGHLAEARGSEELTAWRHPLDLPALLAQAYTELPARLHQGRGRYGSFSDHAGLGWRLLEDEPGALISALSEAIGAGATPDDLGRSLSYAAALRLARFGTANELSDWDSAHHVFTYCNALHQLLKRRGSAAAVAPEHGWEALRGVFHGAMALYLTRYLNVPATPLPRPDDPRLAALPADAESLKTALLDAFDRHQQVDLGAQIVARYLTLGHPADALIATLTQALLREDAGFHSYQSLEAAVRQYREWGGGEAGLHVLIAATRYLAAHAPTERAWLQTATIARRLQRGGKVHEEPRADP